MSRPQTHTVQKHPEPGTRLSWLTLAGVLAYLYGFFRVAFEPYKGLLDHEVSRFSFFTWLLVPEEFFRPWLGPEGRVGLTDRIIPILVMMACLCAALGLGACVLKILIPSRYRSRANPTRTEFMLFSTVIGLALFSALIGWIGLIPSAMKPFVYLATPVCVVPGLYFLAFYFSAVLRRDHFSERGSDPDQWIRFGSFFVLVLFSLLLLATGLIPSTEYDVLSYHFAGAREFAEQGCIRFLPHNGYANMPFGAEMFLLWGIILYGAPFEGALIGKTLIALTTVLTALGLYTFGKCFFSERAGLIAMLLYMTTPWINYVSSVGLIDTVVGMYAFFGIYAALLTNRPILSLRLGRIAVAGLLVGAAAACKYPGMLFVVLPVGLYLAYQTMRDSRFRSFTPLSLTATVFLCTIFLTCGSWYLKNAWFTGNPVYPLCYSLFGDSTGAWTADANARWTRVHAPPGFSLTALYNDFLRIVLTSPWNAPLTIPLCLPLCFCRWKKKQKTLLWILLGWTLFVLGTWWLLTHRIDRFWIPIFPVLTLLAGLGAAKIQGRFPRYTLGALLGLATIYAFLLTGIAAPGKLNTVLAPWNDLRRDPMISTEWAVWLNQRPKKETVLLVGEAKAFLYEGPVLYSTCFNEEPLRTIFADPVRELQSRNVDLILVDLAEINRFRSPGNYGYPDFVRIEQFEQWVAEGYLKHFNPPDAPKVNSVRVYRVVRP